MAAEQSEPNNQQTEKESGAHGLEMVERVPDSSNGSNNPVNDIHTEIQETREERVTAKAWLCVFVGLSCAGSLLVDTNNSSCCR